MKVILFGAGASHGAGDTLPVPAPLGRDLFPALARLFPGSWGQIPEEAAALFADDFEAGMATVAEKYGLAVGPLMQKMAIFFSWFTAGNEGSNLYFRLFSEAYRSELVPDLLVSTINYECIAETAANKAGLKVSYFGDVRSDPDSLALWKLHGSCNFKVAGLEATRGVSYSGVAFDGGIEFLNPPEVRRYYSGDTALYPAMALYARSKSIFMAPTIIQNKQKAWAEEVQTASHVIVIGVRPNPADEHIWGPIARTDAEVSFVGSRTGFENWVSAHRPTTRSEFLGSRWSPGFGAVIRKLC